jgi:DNA-binding transcriptional regulator LsrR (DeoR family)
MARRTAAALALAVAAGVAGCGGSDADLVRSALAGYARAFAAHDYQAVCDTYLAPKFVDSVEQRSGLPCESAVRPAMDEARKPTLTVVSVSVHGDSATAQVHTTAENQPPADEALALVKVGGSWRIASPNPVGPQP